MSPESKLRKPRPQVAWDDAALAQALLARNLIPARIQTKFMRHIVDQAHLDRVLAHVPAEVQERVRQLLKGWVK